MQPTRKQLLRKLANHVKNGFDPKRQNISRMNKLSIGYHVCNDSKNSTVVGFKSQCTLSDKVYVNIVLRYLICSCSLRLSCVAEPSNFELWVCCICLSWRCHMWARGWDVINSEREERILPRQLKGEGRYLLFPGLSLARRRIKTWESWITPNFWGEWNGIYTLWLRPIFQVNAPCREDQITPRWKMQI